MQRESEDDRGVTACRAGACLARMSLLVSLCVGVSSPAATRRERHGDGIACTCHVLMNAEDRKTTGWSVWDGNPPEFENVSDPDDEGNRAIHLAGGTDSGYEFRPEQPVAGKGIVQWRMRMDEGFYHYIECATSEGVISLRYVPGERPVGVVGKEPVVGLPLAGYQRRWVTVRRDVLADLRLLHSDIQLHAVRSLRFRGAGYIDDIRLYHYADADHDLLPDEFEKRRHLDPADSEDATPELVAKVIELTDSPAGNARQAPPGASREEKQRFYGVKLDASERKAMEAYLEERFAQRLAQAPKPQLGRVYRVRLRTGGEMVGRLEGFDRSQVALRTDHGRLVVPVQGINSSQTPALFPQEAARQMAVRDVQKRVNDLIDAKIAAAEEAAAQAVRAPEPASSVDAPAPAPVSSADAAAIEPVPEFAPTAPTATRWALRKSGKPAYDVQHAATPEAIKPALVAFKEWLVVQHRRVGGRIATKLYAKDQRGNAVLYMVMDPAFLQQEYDLRQRMAEGIQQFWAYRCQGAGVADLANAHLVMVDAAGNIVGGSRPENAADVWVKK